MLRSVFRLFVRLIALAVAWLILARIVRHFYKFPMPEFLANAIDNPLRRHFLHPPDALAVRHGIEPGMTVLDVGPGNGTYTVAAARRVGSAGKVVAIDIEPKMIARVERRARAEGITNIDARVADVYDLPFEAGTFDVVYLIAVIGEIPDPGRAIRSLRRVLKPAGTLAFSELLPDPDSPLASSLIRLVSKNGFRLKARYGNFFAYTLAFEKES